ncbi:MAG: ribosome silencing factor [Pseudomonadales bacterium]|nr:ribosome silencing factor [Pseudomonadales bacterium]
MLAIELKQLVLHALEDIKGNDINCIDVMGKTVIADYMVFVSGTSNRHVKALVGNVVVEANKAGIKPIGIEGLQQGEWVLVDLGDILIHVMQPSVRDFYDIESLWDISPSVDGSTVVEC